MKGQGALEYLIIIAAVLGISAVVVLFVTGAFTGISSGADFSKCRVAASNCNRDITLHAGTTCSSCETACVDSKGKDLIDQTLGCGIACQMCKMGVSVSQGASLTFAQTANMGFNEGAGGTTADSYGNIGTISGAAWVAGRTTSALRFDGIDDYVIIPSSTNFDVRSQFTLSAWINVSASSSYKTIIQRNGQGANRGYLFIYTVPARNYIAYQYGNATGYYALSWPVLLTDDKWHHVAFVKNENTVTAYIDGANLGSKQEVAPIDVTANTVYIGSYSPSFHPFNGTIDDLRAYNRSLSDAEIALLYSS